MNRSQADRARVAARVTSKPPRSRPVHHGQAVHYVGRARKSPRMTAIQRDSTGRISAWSRSPYAPKGGWR